MKAELLPLEGKYYGTEIILTFDDEGKEEYIILWDVSDGKPSIREIEMRGYTKEQYENNDLVDDGYGKKTPIHLLLQPEDDHFESELTYKRALEIVELLNIKNVL